MIFVAAFLVYFASSSTFCNHTNTMNEITCDSSQYLLQTNNATNNVTINSCRVPSGNLGVQALSNTLLPATLDCSGVYSGYLLNCSHRGVINSIRSIRLI